MSTLNNQPVLSVKLDLPRSGQWRAVVETSGDAIQDAQAKLISDDVTLIGAITKSLTGEVELLHTVTITGGLGLDLSTILPAKSYNSAASVQTITAVEDVLRETGHQLDTFLPTNDRLGIHFVREKGSASSALRQMLGENWRVQLDGKIAVGKINLQTVKYTVLSHDPKTQRCVLALENLADIRDLPVPEVGGKVSSASITQNNDGCRAECYLTGLDLVSVLKNLVRQTIKEMFPPPPAKYRVVQMEGNGKVQLLPVDEASGYPPLTSIPQWAGVGGMHTELKKDQQVVVSFLDRSTPVITSYEDRNTSNFEVNGVVFNNSGDVAARVGDAVEAGPQPGMLITIGAGSGPVPQNTPLPFTFSMVAPIPGQDPTKFVGTITSSDSKVKL